MPVKGRTGALTRPKSQANETIEKSGDQSIPRQPSIREKIVA
jgi:hypothetical protein